MDFTEIVKAAAMLIAAVMTYFVVPYIRERTTAEQQQTINTWVRIAVMAAEQTFVGLGRGVEKKRYVLEWLDSHGIEIDETAIDALIEAAVYELNEGVI